MNKEEYKYKLSYIEGEKELTHIFSGYINASEMRDNLKDFLRACSWSEEGIKKILGEVYD